MKYGFHVYQTNVEGHVFWVAESKELKGCVGQGDTMDVAIAELESNEDEWLDAAKKYGIEIPATEVKKMPAYSGKFMVRISPIVHEEAVREAQNQGISLNQYVNDAIVVRNTANTTINMINELIQEYKVHK